MINKILKFILIIIVCLLFPLNVNAHSGRTDSKGCHQCNAKNTNCAKWGLTDYEYHCHSGDTYTNSKGQTFNKDGVKIGDPVINNPEPEPESQPEPTPTPQPEPPVSNDVTIKSLKVNGKSINFDDNMVVETTKKKLYLDVITNSNKAKVDYDKKELVMGENKITIKVTAEDGTEKEYKLIVKRIEGQGTATFIELSIGTYDIEFDNYKASILLTKGETLDGISYKLSDENAIVKLYLNDKEVYDIKNLKGDNILTLVTTDEDNNKLTYEVEIDEMGLIGTIFFYAFIIVILVGPIAGCVFIFKFIKK